MPISRRLVAAASALVVATAGLVVPTAIAVQPEQDSVVSAVPADFTPRILDGRVFAIAQVGNTMVVGGTFTSAAGSSGSPSYSRDGIIAFNATTGAVSAFNPSLNGAVNSLLPGPQPNTVLVGGSFTTVNGASSKSLVLLNLANGQIVNSFDTPAMNGVVNDMAVRGDRLFLAGTFAKLGGQDHRGLGILDYSTGAVDHDAMRVQLTENHNWNGSGARAAIGPKALDVTPDGKTLVAIGNFKKADDLDRDQAVLIDVSGATAQVLDWRTRRYEPRCFSNAYDTYMRDVDFSPSGDYFVAVATGGPNPGSLCDTAARWETAERGDAVEPTWIDDTGGDTLHSVAITGEAVYVGGHQRWSNNAGGRDFAAPGAVPRPGLAALDPVAGVPISWNPGRQPRGAGAFVLYATDQGLWLGSDTQWIGKYQYLRPRLAFFPLDGGAPLPPADTPSLPSAVYLGGQLPTTGVLYRVNAGGPTIASQDTGPAWQGDEGTDSTLRNSGSNRGSWSPISSLDATVPDGTPAAIYSSERWDPSGGEEMQWAFPVPSGTEVEVRLFLANQCDCTSAEGARVQDVLLEGDTVLDDLDMVKEYGHKVGHMESFTVTSDGEINVDFGHVVENTLVNGFEIRLPDADTSPDGVYYRLNAGGPALLSADSGPDWSDDTAAGSTFRTGGSNAATWGPVPAVDATVPSGAPQALFSSERWDPSGGDEMQWTFPVPAGVEVDVRLYIANRFSGTSQPGQRVFDVSVEGNLWLDDLDIADSWGSDVGHMESTTVTSDGAINIDFGHVVENTLINGIEITEKGYEPSASAGNTLVRRPYAGATAGPVETRPDGGVEWGSVRGAVRIDNEIFYGTTDGRFNRRTFDGESFGPATYIDPYNDPFWSDVDNNSGSTYRGVVPTFYSEVGSVTGLAYRDGKLYYTMFGESGLYYRAFSTDSGIVSPERFQVSGITLPSTAGVFGSGDMLYMADRATGNLFRLQLADDGLSVVGGSTVVSGPAIDGADWRARAIFLGPGPSVPPDNYPPNADFDFTCVELTCDFDGSDSSDSDGQITSFDWDFPGGATDSGQMVSFPFPNGGSFDVTLTVTDNAGATDEITKTVTVTGPPQDPTADISFTCVALTCEFDGSGSSDADGDVVEWDWDFGDLGAAAGVKVSHPYAAAGKYVVTLTVTDEQGATGSTTVEVEPAEQADSPVFRAVEAIQRVSTEPRITIPDEVQPGDGLLLFLSINKDQGTVTAPDGWTQVAEQSSASRMRTILFQRSADAGDPGQAISPTLSVQGKASLVLLAYEGTGATPVEYVSSSADKGTAFTTPELVATDGGLVLSFWATKSSAVTDWIEPPGEIVRSEFLGSGTGRVDTLATEGPDAVSAGGTAGGLTATTDAEASLATMWTVVLSHN